MYLQPFANNFINDIYMPLQLKIISLNQDINSIIQYASFHGSFCLNCNHYTLDKKKCSLCGQSNHKYINTFDINEFIIPQVIPRKVNHIFIYLLCLKYNGLVKLYDKMCEVNGKISDLIVLTTPKIIEK